MDRRTLDTGRPAQSHPLLLGACAVFLVTGCATAPNVVDLRARDARVEPVYRVKLPAGTAAGQYAVGRVELAAGRLEASILRFRQALELDPGFADAHNGLGVAHGTMGRFEQAIENFLAALATGPGSAHVWNNLGYAQWKTGRLDDAWKSFERSLALDPVNARTRANVAQLAEEQRVRAERMQAEAHASEQTGSEAGTAEQTLVQASSADPASALSAERASGSVPGEPGHAVEFLSMRPSPKAEPDIEFAAPEPVEIVAAPEPSSVEAVRPPEVVVAAQDVRPWQRPAPKVASAIAAVVTAGQPHYEIVLAKSNASTLVQTAPNVYELRHSAVVEQVASETVSASGSRSTTSVAASTVPSDAARSSSSPASLRVTLAALDDIGSVEISNAVGTRGLAGRTASRLSKEGVHVARVSDYGSFGLAYSEIQYREGHAVAATRLQAKLPLDARLVSRSNLRDGVDLRLVVGRDLAVQQRAWYGDQAPAVANAAHSAPAISDVAGLEVSNAVGIRHLAARTAQRLARFGAEIARLSNYSGFGKQHTEIHYRSGHLAGARAVQQRLPVEAKLVHTDVLNPSVNVRLVVGNDMVANSYAWHGDEPPIARTEPGVTARESRTSTTDSLVREAPSIEATQSPIEATESPIARNTGSDGWRHL